MKAAIQILTTLSFGVAGNVPMVLAQFAGTFTATGNMVEPRTRHTATLLANGKVLIAGGAAKETVELYDPATGIFAPTGGMTTIRTVSSATLLPDGRVLVIGGDADHKAYAEL